MILFEIDGIVDASSPTAGAGQLSGFLQALLDSFEAHVAVVDSTGMIVAVNSAWERFGRENQLAFENSAIGRNYITYAQQDLGECGGEGIEVAQALKEILAGEQDRFSLVYPCHSPSQHRWFQLRITALDFHSHRYALLAHENITQARIQASTESEDRLHSAVESTDDGVLILEATQPSTTTLDQDNQEFRIVELNEAASYWLALNKTTAMNSLLSSQMPGFLLERLYDRCRRVLETNETLEEELEIAHPDYPSRWLRLSTLPSKNGVTMLLRNMSTEVELRRRYEDVEQRLDQFTQTVPGMIYNFTLDATGKASFPFVSSGCTPLFDLEPLEIVEDAQRLLSMIHPEDLADYLSAVEESRKNLTRFDWEGRYIKADNSIHWAKVASHPERLPCGGTSWNGLLMDITVIKSATERAEELLQMKQQFIAIMSHELRTPLNGIVGMSKLLEDTSLNENQQEMLSVIQEAASSLLSVVREVLEFSKIDKQQVVLQARPFSIPNVLRAITGIFKHDAHAQGIDLELIFDKRIPEWVEGDADRLKQVLINLIHNAIKFSKPQTEVALKVDLIESNRYELQIAFTVQDSGKGISNEDLEKIFMPFVQVAPETKEQQGGTGLGLAISANLVKLMGGELKVDSELGKGSSFRFCIPLAVIEQRAETTAPEAMPTRLIRSLNILLADDDAINRIIATRLLERHGHHVVLATDGAEAVSLCETEDFELILMDMEMPNLNGIEATERIRSIDKNANVPVVALTAHTGDDAREKYLRQGLDGFLSKPLIADELYEIIAKLSQQ